jgi:hypothetical protein
MLPAESLTGLTRYSISNEIPDRISDEWFFEETAPVKIDESVTFYFSDYNASRLVKKRPQSGQILAFCVVEQPFHGYYFTH